VEVLFDIIRGLRSEGKIIVYISHKLDELFRIADRYVVLRDGRTVESGDRTGMTFDNIVLKMVGDAPRPTRSTTRKRSEEAVLTVADLTLPRDDGPEPFLKNISFATRKGEILGIFGLMGAGRTELLEALFGLHARTSEFTAHVDGNATIIRSPLDAIAAGLALVPEDRKRDGLVLDSDVRTNVCITTLGELSDFGLLNERKETALTSKYVSELRIKASSQQQVAGTLSGGNQQKVVLAKWLATNPKVLLLDEPTRGIDVRAKAEIYDLIDRLAGEGLSIIMVSSELPEILAVTDRVLVMSEGSITAEFATSEVTENDILKAAIPRTT
jgi:ribose transport system ATP-binding protein